MEPPMSPPPPRTSPEPARRRRLLPASAVGAVAVLASVLWATGGLKETPQEPGKAPGKPIDLGWFDVTVRDARIATVQGVFDKTPQRRIVVRLRVVNKGKETATLGRGGFADGVAARTAKGTWLRPDEVEGTAAGAPTDVVQPGLPVEAAAQWRLGPQDSPATFTVGLRKWKFDRGFTDTSFRWRLQAEKGDALAGRLTLRVARS
ncbi:hypothetical protein [Actinomadura rubrobrunea]|uniref:hypothetical protein n=1 Tax=Actinomadura rubrobrunea TaxID=115335 RepID=UPI0011B20E48|nr:hypothetical protein [Actinomadura rubrobrunea]